MNKWMDEQMDGQTNGWTNERTFVPLELLLQLKMGYECTLNSNRQIGYESSHMLNSNRKIGY